MDSQLAPLALSDIEHFERYGYVVVRQAFPRADALAMERQWWRELEDTHGIRPDDRSSWRQIVGDLKAAKRDPIQAAILTERVRGVLDDLLGKAAWSPPRDWGRPIVTFPQPGRAGGQFLSSTPKDSAVRSVTAGRATGMSSAPTTAMSAGTARPSVRMPARTAMATSSLKAHTPVTERDRQSPTAQAALAASRLTSAAAGGAMPAAAHARAAPSRRCASGKACGSKELVTVEI